MARVYTGVAVATPGHPLGADVWHRTVGYHEKYMNGSNTGIFKKNSVCSSTHPHENSGATGISNVSYAFRERRTGAPEFMADRRIL